LRYPAEIAEIRRKETMYLICESLRANQLVQITVYGYSIIVKQFSFRSLK